MRRIFASVIGAGLLWLCALMAYGQTSTPLEKMNPLLRMAVRTDINTLTRTAALPEKAWGLSVKDGDVNANVFIRTSLGRAELEQMGIQVHALSAGIFTAAMPIEAAIAVASDPGIISVTLASKAQLMLDVSAGSAGTSTHRLGCDAEGAWPSTTGQGVIAGIVDSGIDWTHQDFIKDSGTGSETRIISCWDQTLVPIAGENSPGITGLNYGVEYTGEQINNELSGITSGAVRTTDTNGHGTHVAGIAGGNGTASDGDPLPPTYIGMAPEAEFIIVKSNLLTSGISDAVNYIFQTAAALGKPAVVNLSLGNHYGPHDGTSDFETFLDGLTGPGRIIVAAAGNSYGDFIHAEGVVPSGGSTAIIFHVPSSPAVDDIWIDCWTTAGDTYKVSIVSPGSATAGPVNPGSLETITLPAEGVVTIDNLNASGHPDGDKEIFIRIEGIGSGAAASGLWAFTLERVSALGDGGFDAWVSSPSDGTVPFLTNFSEDETVAIPGTAKKLITVAAHTTKIQWLASNGSIYGYTGLSLGAIAPFSSQGPTRSTPSRPGRLKPEISAPGLAVASAMSADALTDPPLIVDDGRHKINQGTSMSAPHVTGAITLYMKKAPDMTPARALDILSRAAWRDDDTGSVPNFTWGYGKMNVKEGLNDLTAAENWFIYE
ncbi:MAG TPA: S8 family peptidase [Candidatus Sumerlaeota bacterium]|nr:S8 family peptidase [Candidatus Sumerlaeota bacterium]